MIDNCPGLVNISAVDRVEILLSLPKPGRWCNGGPTIHLRSIADPTRERGTRYACKSWACSVCSCWLKNRVGQHYGMCVLQSDGWLYSERSEPQNWARDKKRLQRQGANWVRVGSMKRTGFLLVCAPADAERKVYSDTESAVRDLGQELRSLVVDSPSRPRENFRPIASSPGWKPPKKPRKYESLGWIKAREPEVMVNKLVLAGVARETIRTRRGNGLRSWDVLFQCEPDQRERVAEALAH